MAVEKILFVDDEPNILEGIKRQFRREFVIATASRGEEALQRLKSEGPFAVVVSDLRMPEMDGIQFLSKAREISPDSVRMMLTGNADISAAMQAVNEGNIFRFMAKPCPSDILSRSLRTGLEQYRLQMAERDLLEKTLHGSVKVLTDILGMVNPAAFGRAARVKRYVRGVAKLVGESLGLDAGAMWQYDLAAMLSQIGCVALPPNLLKKVFEGGSLSDAEQRLYDTHPKIGKELIANIPRLEDVAEIIVHQNLHYDGSEGPPGARRGSDIPLGSRILKVVLDYDALVSSGSSTAAALATLTEHTDWYDAAVLRAMETLVGLESQYEVKKVSAKDLNSNMILAENVLSTDGQILIAKGFELSPSILRRLEHFAQNMPLREPICVLVPAQKPEPAPRAEKGMLVAG